ncbi:MAG: TonB-dependent receptor, partial [Colwellia sp.]
QSSFGFEPDLEGITFDFAAGAVTTVPTAEPIEVTRKYTDILPSFNVKLDLTDNFLMRFSANRTMSRPSLTSISPKTTVSAQTLSMTTNNPELDPFRADNFDITAEYYFEEGGAINVGYFYKDIVSLVETKSDTVILNVLHVNTNESVPTEFSRSQLVNDKGMAVNGVELSYQQPFDFMLEGLGVLTNYTFVEPLGDAILQGNSKHNYTVSGYYETDVVGARLTYTYRDGYFVKFESGSRDDVFADAYGTLDATLSYSINENFTLTFDATNLLEELNIQRFQPIDLPYDTSDSGRRFSLGVRATF